MRFQTDLVPATLTRRYKRFLADVVLEDGGEAVAHCPNPGAMTGLAEPGMRVWLEPNEDPRKKLKFGWRLAEVAGRFVCIDTGVANRVVGEALAARSIPGLGPYDTVRPEVKFGDGNRVDFLLSGGAPDLYLEVKSVTLVRRPGLAEFPDTRTARGAKHQAALAQMVAAGHRAAVLYVVMHAGSDAMAVAADIDPAYAQAAAQAGLPTLCHAAEISPQMVVLGRPLPLR